MRAARKPGWPRSQRMPSAALTSMLGVSPPAGKIFKSAFDESPTRRPNLEIWAKIRLRAKSLFCVLILKISKTSDPLVFFLALFRHAKIDKNPFWKDPTFNTSLPQICGG